MPYDAPRLALQASSTVYAPLKDLVSYIMDKAKFVENLSKMIVELASFYSRKDGIDRILETDVSREKNSEYGLLVKRIGVLHKRYDKFVNKYQGLCQNLPSFKSHDASSAANLIDAVHERKPTVLTRKFFKLASLSKKMMELLDDISTVNGKMRLENVSHVRKIEPVQVKHHDIDHPSFTEYVKKIVSCLSEDGTKSVGIQGPIGVGKTTIMEKLNNELEHLEFDIVISIDFREKQDAGDDGSVEVIQDKILERLTPGYVKAKSKEQNAQIISRFLQDKKYILLIDHVSSIINFDDVGIHKGHKFGKVVVASSSKKFTRMADQQVEIKPLSEEHAWELFQKVCGTIYDERIKRIAKNIVGLCGGLPLVVKLVANYLRGEKDADVWSDVKRDLLSETKGRLKKLDAVGEAYKLVYDRLEDSRKKCLLFVTLFPSDRNIYKDHLVECWNAERFLRTGDPQLRIARESAAATLKELTDQYLLQKQADKHVKMPAYFRKVAVELEYPGEAGSLSWFPQNNQPLTEQTWETAKRMSLISYKSKLPDNPRTGKMSTLLMQRKPDLASLGDSFFQNMQTLLILDMHKTMIASLPISISSLVSLRCLYLNDCPLLVELPQVEKLAKLELLDIRGTKILSLPSEMGELFHLRCLRISFGRKGCNHNQTSREVMVIPCNLIGHLHQLEELTIEAGCCCKAWNTIAEEIVTELVCLEKLHTLNFHFPSVSIFEKFVVQSKSLKNTDTEWDTSTLRSFDISIGCCKTQLSYGSQVSPVLPERRLRFSTTDCEEISSVKEVLAQTSSFQLVGHSGVDSLSDFNLKNAGTLKVCVVERCEHMTSIVDGPKVNEMLMEITEKEETGRSILCCLEKLHLYDLQTLQFIWKGPVFSGSLANLKDLTLSGCLKLTVILNHEQARALSSLKYVKVENCSEVVQIINEENPDEQCLSVAVDRYQMLNKVKTIDLVGLPMLQSICETGCLNWRSLEKIAIRSCNILGDIHMSLRNAEKLKIVECEKSWWDHLPKEQNNKILPCCHFIVVEQKTASNEGASWDPMKQKGKEKLENGNNLLMSNTNNVYHELAESSCRAQHVTHQPTNKNTSEICSNVDFSISSHKDNGDC